MNEFKNFITCALGAIALILTVVASAGAINYGVGAGNSTFYAVAGFCNLIGWGGLICWQFYKRFIKKDKKEGKE